MSIINVPSSLHASLTSEPNIMTLALRKAAERKPAAQVVHAFIIISLEAGVEPDQIAFFLHRNPVTAGPAVVQPLQDSRPVPAPPTTEDEARAVFVEALGGWEAAQLFRQINTWAAQDRAAHAQRNEARNAA